MRNLGDTISRLAARRAETMPPPGDGGRLRDIGDFGSNPGGLRGLAHVPAGLQGGAPLVVVLHGCTQTAAGYDAGSGWSQLADAAGFAVLFPEQQRANNANLCFNWFAADDIRHGGGETLSIRQMIDAVVPAHGCDRRRIFITGLSAGGAMAMALLATAPEVFAGGAIVAGLPFGMATSIPEAFDRMRGQGLPDAMRLADRVRAAAPGGGPPAGQWPRLSVWQGDADKTVDPANAEAIIACWLGLQGLATAESMIVGGARHRRWRDAGGRALIEAWNIPGLGHGTPITGHGAEACGSPAPFMLEAGISSTRRIADFWGIAPLATAIVAPVRPSPSADHHGIEAAIGQALRQAGLLR